MRARYARRIRRGIMVAKLEPWMHTLALSMTNPLERRGYTRQMGLDRDHSMKVIRRWVDQAKINRGLAPDEGEQ